MTHSIPIRKETFVIVAVKEDRFNDVIKDYESKGWVSVPESLTVTSSYSHDINLTMHKYFIVMQRDVNSITGKPIL